MKHLKVFEQYAPKLVLYHGTSDEHNFSGSGYMTKGSFFAVDREFTDSYGENCYEVQFKEGINIFDATETRYAQLLIDRFSCLYDHYYEEGEDGYEINNADDLTNSPNIWELIENNDGVLQWIEAEGYDGVKMTEEGYVTYLVFSPAKWMDSYTILQ